MKIEPVVAEFKPFNILIESQAEVDMLAGLVGASSSRVSRLYGVTAEQNSAIYEMLKVRAGNVRGRIEVITPV